MLFERIESEGLAHYSYIICDRTQAIVIDPRRDCDIYIQKALEAGCRIAHILETHRHEDFVVGSIELSVKTGAQIWHADADLNYKYGTAVQDEQEWRVGRFKIEAIETPGHTTGSMSYLLYDPDKTPWVVFTGDTLFAGGVGRTDLLGTDRIEQMAGYLYDSIFSSILSLNDGVIVCPAHGSGSVCAESIAERTWTTVGLERKFNPMLQFDDRETFIKNVGKELERPPYFKKMEKLNVRGPPLLSSLQRPAALSPFDFEERMEDSFVLDTRFELEFGAAHVPGALSIWEQGLASFVGWFVPYTKRIILVPRTEDPLPALTQLYRMGYDDVAGFLPDGMVAWHMSGRPSERIETMTVQELCTRIDNKEGTWILDVRGKGEIAQNGTIPGAHNIHLTQLPEAMNDVPKDRTVFIFCGSGQRSMTAASLLKRNGWDNVKVVLGGLAGWSSSTCPLDQTP